jgi:hypothetical protein
VAGEGARLACQAASAACWLPLTQGLRNQPPARPTYAGALESEFESPHPTHERIDKLLTVQVRCVPHGVLCCLDSASAAAGVPHTGCQDEVQTPLCVPLMTGLPGQGSTRRVHP